MPPVADTDDWGKAIDRLLEANEGTDKPATVYALAALLGARDGSTQTSKSWRRTLNRIRTGSRLSEQTASLIAEALGVGRHSLPPSSDRLTMQMVQARLELAEDDHARLRRQFDAFVEATIVRLDSLEEGRGSEAQR